MTDAIRDGNHVPVALGVLSTDATVTTPFIINASGKLQVIGSGTGPGTVNTEVPTGTVNGVNTVFTVVNTPRWIVIDSLWKFDATLNASNPAYTYLAGTLTIIDGSPPVLSIVSFY